MVQYFAKCEDEKREMRRLVETIMQGHHSAREAKTKLQKMKRKIGMFVVYTCISVLFGILSCGCHVNVVNLSYHLF